MLVLEGDNKCRKCGSELKIVEYKYCDKHEHNNWFHVLLFIIGVVLMAMLLIFAGLFLMFQYL
jgi:hypothetical protein